VVRRSGQWSRWKLLHGQTAVLRNPGALDMAFAGKEGGGGGGGRWGGGSVRGGGGGYLTASATAQIFWRQTQMFLRRWSVRVTDLFKGVIFLCVRIQPSNLLVGQGVEDEGDTGSMLMRCASG